MTNKEWLTVAEALNLLKINSRTTLNKHLLKFNVRKSKPMGKVYISTPDLIATIELHAIKMGV